jgi:ADP-ribose pyrophosphatase
MSAVPDPEVLLQTRRFRVERVRQVTPDGREHCREVVRHSGAVVILPLLDDGRVCFVENFRVAVGQTLIELPAGTLEPGEDPAETARRELAEETGYRAGRIEHVLSFWMSPGILDERMHFYVATSLVPGAQNLDAGEDLRPRLATWDEALTLVSQGRIEDSKTLSALLFYDRFRRARNT